MKQLICIVICLSILLTGCSPSIEAPSTQIVSSVPETSIPQTALNTLIPSPTLLASNPAFTSTPDLRLPPERWQEWDIVPVVSARAREIYQNGLAMGNEPHAFSKIGDCQNIPESFLGIYDLPSRYSFTPEYQFLDETVKYYAGSFNRQGEAVRGGFNASSVLLPLWANTEVCQPGENSVECENRIHNPSIAIISLEVWFSGRTPDVYENYMRRIIEYNISQGTLPILSTKADNVEGDHSINYTVAKLAYEYDLPLWNYWRAVQPLPDHGLDATDPTGFHLSVDGWNMRSFTALQVLETIRRTVNENPTNGTTVIASTPVSNGTDTTFIPAPVAGLPYSEILSSSDASASALVFEMSTRANDQQESMGVFQGSLNGNAWQALAAPGFKLLDRSADGILASQNNNLYLLKDSQLTLLTDQLYAPSIKPALWLPDGRIAVIQHIDTQNQIVILSLSGKEPYILPTADYTPVELYPMPDSTRIFWGGAEACNENDCQTQLNIASPLDGSSLQVLPFAGQPAFASDGKMAFITYDAEHNIQLTLVNGEKTRTFSVPGDRLVDMSWSPDGNTLAVSTSNASNYSGRVLESKLFLVTFPADVNIAFTYTDVVPEHLIWSPDGKSILTISRNMEAGKYRIHFVVFDVEKRREIPAAGFSLISEKYLLIEPIFWLP